MTVDRKFTPIDPARFRSRTLFWEGLTVGDRFRVTGKRGEFAFRSAVYRTGTEEVESIECIGLTKVQSHNFAPERVIIPTERELAKSRRRYRAQDPTTD